MKDILATDTFIAREFAAWLGHPHAPCAVSEDFLGGRVTVSVGTVHVAFPDAAYRRLQRMRVSDMPREFAVHLRGAR